MSNSRNELQRWLRLAPTFGMALTVMAAALLLGNSKPPARAATPAPPAAVYHSPLGLRVASKPQQLDAYWDRNSSAIQGATSGVMRIHDGAASEVVPFDAQQLQDGHLSYRPATNDVSIRMEVINPQAETLSESVRVVAVP